MDSAFCVVLLLDCGMRTCCKSFLNPIAGLGKPGNIRVWFPIVMLGREGWSWGELFRWSEKVRENDCVTVNFSLPSERKVAKKYVCDHGLNILEGFQC